MNTPLLSTVFDAINLFRNSGQVSLGSPMIPNLKTAGSPANMVKMG